MRHRHRAFPRKQGTVTGEERAGEVVTAPVEICDSSVMLVPCHTGSGYTRDFGHSASAANDENSPRHIRRYARSVAEAPPDDGDWLSGVTASLTSHHSNQTFPTRKQLRRSRSRYANRAFAPVLTAASWPDAKAPAAGDGSIKSYLQVTRSASGSGLSSVTLATRRADRGA